QFRIDGPRWNLPQTFFPLSLPFTVLSAFGSAAAYNLLVFLSFPLSGLAAYALSRRYTGEALGAAAAGIAFALAPARLGPLFGGHASGFAAAFAPVVLWGLEVALVDGRLLGGLVGGGALLGLAMLDPHYAYAMGVVALGYVALRWRCVFPPRWTSGGALVAFGLLAAAGAGWVYMLRQAFLRDSIASSGRSLGVVRLLSPGPASLLSLETYGGALVLLLALVGLWASTAARPRRLGVFYGAMIVGGLVLGLGPTLRYFPLYELLHGWAPVFGLIRNPQKFRLLTSLGGAVLAGWGVHALLAKLPARVRRPAGVLVLAAVLVETPPWHPITVVRFLDNPAYVTVGREARKVLYLPLWGGDSVWSAPYLYTTTRSRVPMLNGYSPMVSRRYVRDVYEPLRGLNVGHVGPTEYGALRQLGVTHVVVDRALFPPEASPLPSAFTIERLRGSSGLVLEQAADPLWLFRVVETPDPVQAAPSSPVGIFYEAEALFRETGAPVTEARASGRRVAAAQPGLARAGFLMFGPYRLLPGGRYRATFRVRGEGLVLEVTTDDGQTRLAERAVAPGPAFVEETLVFALDRARPVEFRVQWDGRAPAAVDWVVVAFADRPHPEYAFEIEALPHKLGERPDPEASGGWAGYANFTRSSRVDLVTGPARLYPAGRYRLTLCARVDHAVSGSILRLAVTEPAGRTLAQRSVEASELPPGRYGQVSLAFELGQPTVVEFPIGYLGGTGVLFDRLEVTPEPNR
ncbi:MAG TPA: hypothetical protein VHO73_03190, partial [Methylomirabilota bacterium]|nr:hypothetical protein [Methylomirabilota bacterium]